MSNIELVIFDCDGVLVDSEIIGIQIEAELLHAAGCSISIEELTERFSGMSWRGILLSLEKETGRPLLDRLLNKTESLLDTRLPEEVQAVAGVREVLEGIVYPFCICSNTKLSRVEAMLDRVNLRRFFGDRIFSAKDLGEGRSKPKPDVFLVGAERMGGAPSRTVVVEDSVHGVHGAHSAGMTVLGFTGGSHTYPGHPERLREAGAHLTFSHMREFPGILARLVAEGGRNASA